MPTVYADGIWETVNQSGTGDLPLTGATSSAYRTADQAIEDGDLASGDTVSYRIVDNGGYEWGVCTITRSPDSAGGTVTVNRTTGTVTRSSNSGSRIDVAGGGATTVFFALPNAKTLEDQDRQENGGTLVTKDNDTTLSGTLTADGDVTLNAGAEVVDDTNTAAAGPELSLHRNRANPADDDLIGSIPFHGQNDAAEKIKFAEILAQIKDITDGTEDGELIFRQMIAGVLTEVLRAEDDRLSTSLPIYSMGSLLGSSAINLIGHTSVPDSPVVTAVDFTGLSTDYAMYMLLARNLRNYSADVDLRTSTDNGSSFESGASDYDWVRLSGGTSTAASTGDNNDDRVELNQFALMFIMFPAFSDMRTKFYWFTQNTSAAIALGYGLRNTAEANDAIRIFDETQVSGDFYLYGISAT